jgi:glucuronate isomerase
VLRACRERLITGDGEPYEKFCAYVRTIGRAPGNPLYEWSHLELRRAFGIDLTITEKNAPEIWRRANERIAEPGFSARGLIRRFGVRCICTTDDPASDLSWHRKLAEEKDPGFKMLPTFRPDALSAIEAEGFVSYMQRLSAVSGIEIVDWKSLKEAAAQRVEAFRAVGGRLADHGLNSFRFVAADEEEIAAIVAKALAHEPVSPQEAEAYRTALTLFLMGEYEAHGWTLQLHMNVFRNANTRRFQELGPDTGFDSVGDQPAWCMRWHRFSMQRRRTLRFRARYSILSTRRSGWGLRLSCSPSRAACGSACSWDAPGGSPIPSQG